MFLILLLLTLIVALLVSVLVACFFNRVIKRILAHIVGKSLADAWHKYIQFTIIVVGVSGGVQLWELQKHIANKGDSGSPPPMNGMTWVLEIYRTIIETLQSIAWMLLLFFLCGLIAVVIMRMLGQRMRKEEGTLDRWGDE